MKFSYLVGARGVPVHYSLKPAPKSRKGIIAAGIFSVVFIAAIGAFQFIKPYSSSGVARTVDSSVIAASNPNQTFQQDSKSEVPSQIKQFDSEQLQQSIKKWAIANPGSYSVVVGEVDGKVLASFNEDQSYFMASIYKLYLAYMGYQKIDDGTWSSEQPYLDGKTRGQCLDAMIRTSDNPCGEKMLTEIRREYQQNLKKIGINKTSINTFMTNVGDVNKILVLINKGEGLSPKSQSKLMDSMVGQKFRNGLPVGFKDSRVYDKVGFRGQQEYHDAGIIELPDGRKVLVSIMSDGAGVQRLASLAQTIRTSL